MKRGNCTFYRYFGAVVDDFAALGVHAAIDCEAVVFNDAGVSSFGALEGELKASKVARIHMMAFDLLHFDGRAFAGLTLIERKSKLKRLLSTRKLPHGLIRYSDHMLGDPRAIFRKACSMKLEGIVSKRRDVPYRSGRNGDWTKSKCMKADPFIVIGFVPSKAGKSLVGSLVVGFYDDGNLVYAGKVGSGFSIDEAHSMAAGLAAIKIVKPSLVKKLSPDQEASVVWVKPKLVVQVRYSSVTTDNVLRHATLEHFRDDKAAVEIARPSSFTLSSPPT